LFLCYYPKVFINVFPNQWRKWTSTSSTLGVSSPNICLWRAFEIIWMLRGFILISRPSDALPDEHRCCWNKWEAAGSKRSDVNWNVWQHLGHWYAVIQAAFIHTFGAPLLLNLRAIYTAILVLQPLASDRSLHHHRLSLHYLHVVQVSGRTGI